MQIVKCLSIHICRKVCVYPYICAYCLSFQWCRLFSVYLSIYALLMFILQGEDEKDEVKFYDLVMGNTLFFLFTVW